MFIAGINHLAFSYSNNCDNSMRYQIQSNICRTQFNDTIFKQMLHRILIANSIGLDALDIFAICVCKTKLHPQNHFCSATTLLVRRTQLRNHVRNAQTNSQNWTCTNINQFNSLNWNNFCGFSFLVTNLNHTIENIVKHANNIYVDEHRCVAHRCCAFLVNSYI